jgi:hypothetical protein
MDNYTKGKYKVVSQYACGCQVRQVHNDNLTDSYVIEYCSKHNSASDMYESLKAIPNTGKIPAKFWKLRHKALAKVKGIKP